jgi:hypothetical protein
MPNDPLAQILAGLPEAADYDAVHAALMASKRGRRFLSEHADRNRHADTAMIVGAIARVEAALRGDGAPRADAVGDLMEIAAAIDRIQAALAAGAPPAPEVSAAIERLSDIAFMLHERPVEATLCDRLDAAIREIAEAGTRSESAAAGIGEAAELLRALASRVSGMIAQSGMMRGADRPAGENIAKHAASDSGFFALATNDGETFAQAVAELAATLPTFADVAGEPAEAAPQPESGEGGQTPPAEIVPSDNVPLPDEAQPIAAETGKPDNDSGPPQQPSAEVSLSEAVLNQAFSDDYFSSTNLASEAPAREETESGRGPIEEPVHKAAPAEIPSTEPVTGPQEDPDDLFEPPQSAAPAAEATAPVDAEPPRAVPPPPMRAIPRPPGSDPLAAVRDLSEEELIALFS